VSPPSLVPLVELVPTPWTDAEVTLTARSLLEAAGQSPVTLLKEKPGFVLNRLQSAVISEAMHLIADGVISPDDLDRTMRDGLGLRWSFMGPFETMDLNAEDGFAGYVRRYRASYATMSGDLKVHEPWVDEAVAAVEAERRRLVPAAAIEDRRRWRDKALMALLSRRRKTLK
jgi:3-hydroxyacyl-CoA dehydrogenase